jgi:hypothetical protein
MKTDAPVLTGASQKIEDPGLCRDLCQFEVRLTKRVRGQTSLEARVCALGVSGAGSSICPIAIAISNRTAASNDKWMLAGRKLSNVVVVGQSELQL